MPNEKLTDAESNRRAIAIFLRTRVASSRLNSPDLRQFAARRQPTAESREFVRRLVERLQEY
jgi:hypothetical protein